MYKSSFIALIACLTSSCQPDRAVSPRFNHVVIQVSDMERSVNFYTTAFDIQVTNDSIRHLEYIMADGSKSSRDAKVVLMKFPGQDFVYEMAEVSARDSVYGTLLFHHIGIDVEDIDQAYDRAIKAGALPMVPVRLVKTNGIEVRQAFMTGPDGEVIELMQMISGEF